MLNIQSLQAGGYVLDAAHSGSTNVERYKQIPDPFRPIDSVATSIEKFMNDNPDLVLVSTSDHKHHRYLVIRGKAVCLTNEPRASDSLSSERKDFFSEAVVFEPVQCSKGHFFEKRYIEEWTRVKGDCCPILESGNHAVGPIVIDDYFRSVALEEAAAIDQDEHEKKMQEQQQVEVDCKTLMTVPNGNRTITVAASSAKLGGKLLARETLGKIPIVSICIGAFFAAGRLAQRQYIKALIEFGSGVAACFPGLGTGVALSLDALITTHDIYSLTSKKPVLKDVNKALDMLGLPPSPPPTQQEIDRAFRKVSLVVHPDRESNPAAKPLLEKLQKDLNTMKDLLYRYYGFTIS